MAEMCTEYQYWLRDLAWAKDAYPETATIPVKKLYSISEAPMAVGIILNHPGELSEEKATVELSWVFKRESADLESDYRRTQDEGYRTLADEAFAISERMRTSKSRPCPLS